MAHSSERSRLPLPAVRKRTAAALAPRAPIRVTCRRVEPDPAILGTYLSVRAYTSDTVPSLFVNVLV